MTRLEEFGQQRGAIKRPMSIQRALEWAFRDECARVEFDEMGETAGSLRGGVDGIWLMMQRGRLGCQTDDGEDFVEVQTWKVRETQLYGFSPGSIRLKFHDHGMTYSRFEDNSKFERKAETA